MGSSALQVWREGLEPSTRETVDALRALIAAAHDDLVEELKWNAPSFMQGGEHKVTLGLERNGAVRVVLHRGVKPKDMAGFAFDDQSGLAKWPARDRGIVIVRDRADVERNGAALQSLVRCWIEASA